MFHVADHFEDGRCLCMCERCFGIAKAGYQCKCTGCVCRAEAA